jgi:hypothetical protein
LIVYLLLSLLLYFFPTWLHKKKEYRNPTLQKLFTTKENFILHISHRGGKVEFTFSDIGSRENLENTIEAFQNAVHQYLTFMP